jgi:hypothetical protein
MLERLVHAEIDVLRVTGRVEEQFR